MAAAHRVSGTLHLTPTPVLLLSTRLQSWAILLVETVISDVGHANARNGLCRPVSEPPAAFRRVDSLSLLGRDFPSKKLQYRCGWRKEQHTRPKRDVDNHHQMF